MFGKINNYFKLAISLMIIFTFGTLTAHALPSFYIDTTGTTNGSVVVIFNDDVYDPRTSDFTIDYKVGASGSRQFAEILRVSSIDGSRRRYKVDFKNIVTNSRETIYASIVYNYTSQVNDFQFNSNDVSYDIDYKIVDNNSNSITIEFSTSKSDIYISDFYARAYIDDYDKGTLQIRNIEQVYGYSGRRYLLKHDAFNTTNNIQFISIELAYLSGPIKKLEYTLFPSGSISNDKLGSDYKDRLPASFVIRSIRNGEMTIRFDSSISSTLDRRDFEANYYIDNSSRGRFNITDVEEVTGQNSTDFILYFDPLSSSYNNKKVTAEVFYLGETRKPAYNTFTVDQPNKSLNITFGNAGTFKDKLLLPEITVSENERNLIYPSNTRDMEYISLDAPSGFEWTLDTGTVTGYDGLKNIYDYENKYGVVNGVTNKNMLLIGIAGLEQNRSTKGKFVIKGYELKATDKASIGEVKLRIAGLSIPYEKFTVGTLIESQPTVINKREIQIKVNSNYMSVNGSFQYMDTNAFSDANNRLMIPVSFVANAFGVTSVDWNKNTRVVTIIDGTKTVTLTIGSRVIIVDGVPVQMDTEAIIKDNRTFIPLRYLAEALGFRVSWDQNSLIATAVRN